MHWLVILGTGFFFGLVLTRFARNSAGRVGLIDSPDGRRKTQSRPVPVAGGVAVLCSAIIAILVANFCLPEASKALVEATPHGPALLIAAILITLVGVVDDARNLRARYKFLGQVLAVGVLIFFGDFRIHVISLLGHQVELDMLSIPFTAFWMLACINALNLIDGMDGLLGTVGLIALMSLAVIATMVGHTFTAVVALAMAGSLIGFLWYNLPPATIYMGDSGSMLIGLTIGALAIPASLKGPATVALGAPVALLVLPMMDTTAAVIRRKLTGRGLATADRGHLHHVLQRNGLTTRRALLLIAALGLMAAAGALASTAQNNDVYALVAVGGVVLTLLSTRLFGNAEWTLVKKRLFASAKGVWGGNSEGAPWELSVRLQGNIDWDQVWHDITDRADDMQLYSLCLDVNAPALHENYHARWDRRGPSQPEGYTWRLELPLFGSGHLLGRVTVSGSRDGTSLTDTLMTLASIIEGVEARATVLTTPVHGTPALPIAPHPTAVTA